ncbi:MAG TPA: L-threonylcarbamoyladenylate synthase [Bryobacteraceae bacterium]|nr:L-threonylcarbamoyladenylate synthase [Bryobacteraceae bacterium]
MNRVAHAAALIRAGRLVAFPTETVYGLGANALDAAAVERIFAAKGRPRTSPMIVHVDSIAMAQGLAARWPDAAETLARRYWPGPLTLVVPKRPEIPDVVTAGLATVGLRMPAHPLALELIRAAGVPIAAPSANRFTGLSPTGAAHIPESLADYVLDGGPASVGIESTVIGLVDAPLLLRPGVIPLPEIVALIGPVEVAGAPGGAHASPGMHPRHYCPATPLYLLARGEAPPDGRGAWLRMGREMPGEPRAYAAALYDTLHRLDARQLDWIAVEAPPDAPEWAGVLDRLRRAASVRGEGKP